MDEKTKGMLLIGAVVFLTLLLVFYSPDLDSFKNLGVLGAFLIGLVTSATVILPLPGIALIALMGRVLNPISIGIAAGIGSAIGELTGYIAGYGGSSIVKDNGTYERIRKILEKYGLFAIFIFALIPNPLFDIAGIAAGSLRLSWWRFLVVAALGKMMKFIAFAYLGDASNSLIG
ncbi:VTT domain-containing protein [Candidatus Micrarchaeota archaeon]|nr:VTT domain-containing protein [Candidatus Micrarchaeota archaeon]